MKISELSTMEIKALLYDSLMEKQRIMHNIKMLEDELMARQDKEAEESKPEKDG